MQLVLHFFKDLIQIDIYNEVSLKQILQNVNLPNIVFFYSTPN